MNNEVKILSKEKDFRVALLNPRYRILETKTKIVISIKEGIEIIAISDIVRCQAESNYCKIITRSGRVVLASKTLKIVEAALGRDSFVRVHQSHLVNLNDVLKVGNEALTLSCGSIVPVSRAKRKMVIDRLCGLSHII